MEGNGNKFVDLPRRLPPPLPPAARKPGASPLPAAARKAPPPRPATAPNTTPITPPLTRGQIAIPYEQLTVDNLVAMFSLQYLKQAVTYLRDDYGSEHYSRPAAQIDMPGGLLVHDGQRPVVLVGDKHGNEARLDLLLRNLAPRLAAGEIELAFMGDLLHPEEKDNLSNMASSLRVLKVVIMLKALYPDRVHLTLGNHDILFTKPEILKVIVEHEFLRPEEDITDLAKYMVQNVTVEEKDRPMFNGKKDRDGKDILQSLILLRVLIKELKDQGLDRAGVIEAVSNYQSFFDGCPLAILIDGLEGVTLAMHSIPKVEEMDITPEKGLETRRGVHQNDLIEGRFNGLMFQILWNRLTQGDFSGEDVIATIKNLAEDLGIDPDKINVFAAHEHFPGTWWVQPFENVKFGMIHGNVSSFYGAMMVVNGRPQVVNVPVADTPAEAAA